MKLATVVFLEKDGKIILAKKKQHIHIGEEKLKDSKEIYNGYSGKLDEEAGDKDIGDTAIRELNEETGKEKGVFANKEDLKRIGEIQFFWPGNISNEPNMYVYFYLVNKFEGYPVETEEMFAPEEFNLENLPYHKMMGADKELVPKMFKKEGEIYKAKVFHFENGEYKIEEIDINKEFKKNLNSELKLR